MRHWSSTTAKLGMASALLAVVSLGAACGGSKKAEKDEEPENEVVEKSRMEKFSERTGMEQEALEKFEKAVGELNSEKPDNEKIENLLTDVVETEPKFAEAHYNLGVLYSNLEKNEDAVRHLQKAHDIAPGKLDYTVALAQAYATDEQYSQARDLFEEVVTRQPNNLTAKNNLAVMALRQGDREAALQHIRDVLREDKENVGALNVLGLIYRQKGNLSLAKYAFQKALEFDENNADIHNNLGLVYLKEDDLPSAVDAFTAATKADPNYLESRLNIGAIFLEYLDYDRAFEQFKEAVRIAPNNCTARLGKGATAFAKQKYEMSAENYQYYVDECDAEHVSSYDRLAKLYQNHLGDKERALEYYGKLVEICETEEKCASYKATRKFLKKQVESGEQKSPEEGDEAAEEGEASDDEAADDAQDGESTEEPASSEQEGAAEGEEGGSSAEGESEGDEKGESSEGESESESKPDE